jgi:hypothetical protein
MYSQQQRISKQPANPYFAPQTDFAQTTPVQETQPISPEEVEKIKASGSNWPDVSIFTTNRPAPAPRPRVQMKLNLPQKEVQPQTQTVTPKTDINNEQSLEQEVNTAQEGLLQSKPVENTTDKTESVQLKRVNSNYGTFEDKKYEFINNNNQVDFELEFTPNNKANATKVGLTQTVKVVQGGNITAIDPNTASKMTPQGFSIDRVSDKQNPLYATSTAPDSAQDKLESYKTEDLWGQHAEKNKSGWTPAILKDKPTTEGGKNSSKEFETTALAIEGKQKGTYYGSVKWGWKRDEKGKFSLINFDIVSKGVPSKNFMEAAKKWNTGKTRGTLIPKANGTKVYNDKLVEIFTIDADTELTQLFTAATDNDTYVAVEVISAGKYKGKKGLAKVNDLRDKGDGKNTVDLPIVKN